MKFSVLLLTLLFYNFSIFGQRNSIWVFGDSTGIDFSNSISPSFINSSIDSRGSCISMADLNGKLIYYGATMPYAGPNPAYSTILYDSLNSIMQNGDSIFGKGWYHELVTFPMPANDSLYYLFSIGVTTEYGLRYSIINMNGNNGLGEVIQKNIPLQNFPMVDCLTAVKHGNGRDWWLVFRRWYQNFNPTNEFFTYLVSPTGITNFNTQTIGSTHQANQGELTFSPNGERIINTDGIDLLELFDFNRCTGILSNPITIQQASSPSNYHLTWSSAFSPSGNLLYVSTSKDTSYLYQFDLTSSNILASRITLDTFYLPPVSPGALKLAPDGKIYFSCAYDNGVQFNYPYQDTMYNYVNMNLSVINFPDNLGTACGYAPFSFYLGGKRTYYGLPNNPDYDLGPLIGSPCDTLVGINNPAAATAAAAIFVYYAPNWQTAFINANKLQGTSYKLQVIDAMGRMAYSENGNLNPPYFTKNLNCSTFANGMYIVVLETEKEKLTRKFLIE